MSENASPDTELLRICRELGSPKNLFPTSQLIALQDQISEMIISNSCGFLVVGPSRCGKTSAIRFCTDKLRATYGEELPVILYTATTHIATQKSFYESILFSIGETSVKGTANQMRSRIINRLVEKAIRTTYQMVIMWIDEAYLLHETELNWLIDIYNELAFNEVQFTVIMVGTKELVDLRKGLITAGKQQIIQRFMTKVIAFHGIETPEQLLLCLAAVDSSISLHGNSDPEKLILSKRFFPDAYLDGKTMADAAEDFWLALQNIRHKNHIATDYLTMKNFVDCISYCIRNFGAMSKNPVYFPTVAEWEKALNESGFTTSVL